MRTGYREAKVVVAGGGAAGVVAAIAAARQGADTLLVERQGFLGGMFTGGNMTVLTTPSVGGLGKEIVDTLMAQDAARRLPDDPPNYPVFHYSSERCTFTIAYEAEMAKLLLFRLAREAGVRLLLHSFITGAVVGPDGVSGITVVNKSGSEVVRGDVVVDATADGDVAAGAGAPFRKGQTERAVLFAMTLLVRLSHVDWAKLTAYSRTDPGWDRAIQQGIAAGELPYYKPRSREMVNYWGHPRPELSRMVRDDEALMWGGTVEGVDGTNVDDLTRAEAEVREQFVSELTFLKRRIPGFQQARIENSGVTVGVRDTRHIIGEYTLTGADILNRRRFPDGVAYNVKAGIPANEIPYRCLVPLKTDGLLLAGNCLSVMPGSTFMGLQLGSYNNIKDIPSMWTNGEAAGIAAALCIKTGVQPRKLDVPALQSVLRDCGALVPAERVPELEAATLPSGKTAKQFYEETMADCRAFWQSRGESVE
ncbi:MAG TPA: FAD-dependent oxidoreductase [Candidatus Sulfotelmatobacter sp.]|nr:FAD-dependent oxidoreductase [Candidatus Sulfotelmatobacter sp.]